MKNLTKIFMAVVAGVFAFSCVTDTTVDSNPTFESEVGGVKTVLSVSIADSEELRTQLGAWGETGYPMYWSNGDKISVNGVASNELSLGEGVKTAAAEFGFGTSLSTPYYVAYPAAAEGQVKFAAAQSHAGNSTFGNNAAAMWGYSENGEGIQLNHLTGVLKIGVVADEALVGKKLTYAQVSTIDRAPIAGDFAFDFAKGELGEPTATATEVISYSFGEGAALSTTEPTYLHIAVPAGKYDELYVTLYDNDGGVMYATVKAGDSMPLAAGKVREFKKDGVEQLIKYAPNAEVFVIKDAASLDSFAKAVKAATTEAPFTKDVLFVADVDASQCKEALDFTWNSVHTVNGVSKVATINGNGYAVKNLTTPLFNYLYANVRGLHIRNANINETVNPNVGTLARRINTTKEVGPVYVEHCSASGEIVVNCPNKVGNKDDAYNPHSVGGIVGVFGGITCRNCINYTNVLIKQTVKTGGTIWVCPCTGGIVGNIGHVGTNIWTNLIDLENRGKLTINDQSFTDAPTMNTHSKVGPFFGGITGSCAGANSGATYKNLVNRGDVTLDGSFATNTRFGGIFGQVQQNKGIAIENVYNYGKVTLKGKGVRKIQMGGCFGLVNKGSMLKNVHNYGEVKIEDGTVCIYLMCGGILGEHLIDSAVLDLNSTRDVYANCSNNAPVYVGCNNDTSLTTNTDGQYYRIGGIAGWSQAYMYNCNNNEKGSITCKGTLLDSYTTTNYFCVGGLVGYKTVNAIDESYNKGTVDCDITMNKLSSNTDLTAVRMHIGGIFGYAELPCRNITNHGQVIAKGNYAGQLRVGGIGAHNNNVSTALTHNTGTNDTTGSVTIGNGTTIGADLFVGGCYGYAKNMQDVKNKGIVTIEEGVTNSNAATYIGGVVGYVGGASSKLYNEGTVKIKDNATFKGLYCGGVIGRTDANISVIENKSTGTLAIGKAASNGANYIGGCFGFASAVTSDNKTLTVTEIKDITNKATINVALTSSGTATPELGGVFGRVQEYDNKDNTVTGGVDNTLYAATTTNIYNHGPITVTSTSVPNYWICGVAAFAGGVSKNMINYETGTISIGVTSTGNLSVGGVCQTMKDNCSDICNKAAITIDGVIASELYCAGVIVTANNYSRTRCNNEGDITVNATIKKSCRVGGIIYSTAADNTLTNCHNSGDIIVSEKAKVATDSGSCRIGGLVSQTVSNSSKNIFDGCSNSGDIIFKGEVTWGPRLAGLIATHEGSIPLIIKNGFTNSGDIIFSGKNKGTNCLHMAGVIGVSVKNNSSSPTYSNTANPTWTGDVKNTGKIEFSGATGATLRMSGIFGGLEGDTVGVPVSSGKFINEGDLICTGTVAKTGDISGIGGIVADIKNSIGGTLNNAIVNCNIQAWNFTNVGMVFGGDVRTDKVKATNCQVAGTIDKGEDGPYQDEFGEDMTGWHSASETLTADNFHKYIYSATVDASVATGDGCSFYVAPTPAQ